MQGYQPERISTPAIEALIRSLPSTTLSNARAWTYQQGGHGFYCLNIPGAESTWCYDASTGLWHERDYRELWEPERHRADCHALAHGENVVGDYEDGRIYALDQATYTDDGTAIVRSRTAPHFTKELRQVFYSKFQLDMETGVGLDGASTVQGHNPKAMLEWSDDGGHTWSNQHFADIGKIGKTQKRVIWRRLGAARSRTFRISISDPVKTVLIGADLEYQEGIA
jgi:hypothetical protein